MDIRVRTYKETTHRQIDEFLKTGKEIEVAVKRIEQEFLQSTSQLTQGELEDTTRPL